MKLNNKIQEHLKIYDLTCNFLVECFIKKYFCDKETKLEDIQYYWVGDRIGEVLFIGDYYFNFEDILTALKQNITRNKLLEWYSWYEQQESGTTKHLEYYLKINKMKTYPIFSIKVIWFKIISLFKK